MRRRKFIQIIQFIQNNTVPAPYSYYTSPTRIRSVIRTIDPIFHRTDPTAWGQFY